jgi:hypothetical protein
MSRMLRVPVTVAYGLILVCVNTTLVALGPAVQERAMRHASTNLHNLSHGHLGTLLFSAFIVDAAPIALWLPGLLCLLGLAEVLWRSARFVVAFLTGHVGATVLVAAGLTAAVTWGWMPAAVARATDVGMSYGATAVLGTFTAAIPRRWRPAWIGWWAAVGIAAITVGRDFTDVGHIVALALGAAVASRFGTPAPWTPVRVALLGIAASFGFLVIANSLPQLVVASVCGVVAIVVVEVAHVAVGRKLAGSATAGDDVQGHMKATGGHARGSIESGGGLAPSQIDAG